MNKTFEIALAEQVALDLHKITEVIDRNPDLPIEVSAALIRLKARLMPLADHTHLRLMRRAYDSTTATPR